MTRRGVPASERVGQRFNRLVILEILPGGRCRAKCDCGNESTPMLGNIVQGLTKACGCLEGSGNRTHGESKSRLYQVRRGMIARCTNPKNAHWKNYGGRGISVCASWLSSWEAFRDDVGPDPGDRLTLDRQNNDGGYWCGKCEECIALGRPANVRWATSKEQANNTRRKTRPGEEPRTLAERARLIGITHQALSQRIKRGVSPEMLDAPKNARMKPRKPNACSICGERWHYKNHCPTRRAA